MPFLPRCWQVAQRLKQTSKLGRMLKAGNTKGGTSCLTGLESAV